MRSLPSNKQSTFHSRRREWNGHAVLCTVGLWLISLTPAWGQLASQSTQVEAAGSPAQKPASAEQLAFFESRIRPVLVKHCYECHSSGSSALKGGLRVDWAGGLTAGGDSGPSIKSGHPEESLLIDALEYDGMEMPPAGKLSPEIIADFKAWIADGAIDPRHQAPTESAVPPKHQQMAASQLWSFQPVKNVVPPDVKATAWPTTAIDQFVLAKLEQAGIAPIEDADLSTLVRRLTFDLTGLPPTPAVVDRLANSPSEFDLTAYIDQLLDSEAYGQHWARHWLDVARYADSNGGDFNATFHEAWRYRNYVIAAFNDDKPFDQFIVEQIAGDLLPADNDQQRTEQLVASGFLMLGAKMLSERDKSKLQMDVVDEQVSIVGTAFMGLTLGCARCHDHKFDPISTQDYYALAGIFKSTYVLEGEIQKYVSNWIRSPLPISDEHRAQLDEYQTRSDALKARITKVEKLIKTLEKKVAAPADAASPTTTTPASTTPASTTPASTTPASTTPASSTPASSTPESVAPASDELATAKAELEKLQAEMQALKKSAPPPAPLALAARDAKEIGDCQVCIRGEPHQLGPVVPRGFIGDLNYTTPPVFTKEQSGRVELAKWLADGRHPLTSRVIVNRIWKNLIGEGIVPSVDNFGALGEAPTHPELLDYLAHEFTTHQWSTKWLIREIVRSHVYQLSSRSDETNEAVDPENSWLWRAHRKRLSAEAIRDTFLMATEELERGSAESPVGGLGTLVTQNSASDSGYAESASRLRTIYQPIIRNELPALMRVFDFADPDTATGGRSSTTVPAQALWMLNGPMVHKQAAVLTKQVLEATTDAEQRIQALYARALGRRPTYSEMKLAREFLFGLNGPKPGEDKVPEPPEERWADLAHAIFAASVFRMTD